MSRSITIADVSDETIAVLADRAGRAGMPLGAYLRAQLVVVAAKPDAAGWLARVQERKAATDSIFPADAILADRDAARP